MTPEEQAAILDALAHDLRADQDASEEDAPEYAAEVGAEASAVEAGAAALRRGWQPIATAPKDGTLIDMWYHGRRVTDVAWHREWQQWSAPLGRLVYEPTHWMPLPDPPASPEVR